MSQAMPMAVNLVNTLVINTGAGATTKHIIVKVLGDVDVEIQLFSQGNKVVVEKQAAQHYRFNNLSQYTPYTLKAIVAGKAEFTLVNEQQFADYFNSNTVKSFNIGSKGGPQLLQHKILPKGHVELTLLAEPPCFGVFFDGTGNNRFNDIQDSTDSKEPTNVVKLFELYPRGDEFIDAYYIEGIGTKANKSDSTLDMGLAFSFDERIKQALIRAIEFFKKFAYTKTGFIDVFGFSRGAAQARAFVNQVNAIYQDKPNYWGGIKPVIRFVGLFDSVASIGGDGDNNHSEFYADDELDYPVNLNLASSSAGYVMHLAAFDEKRDKFPLSSLLSSNKQLSENHKEIELPGVHSDIGGGYGPVETSILYPRQYIAGQVGEPEHDKELVQLKQSLEQKYYWPTINIQFKASRPRINRQPKRIWNKSENTIYTSYRPYWRRKLSNILPHYSLALMHETAVNQGVPLQNLAELANRKQADGQAFPYVLPSKLKSLVDTARSFGPQSDAWHALYKDYIHHSVKYAATIDAIAHGPEEEAEFTTKNQQRELFYNQPNQAETSSQWQSQLINGYRLWTSL